MRTLRSFLDQLIREMGYQHKLEEQKVLDVWPDLVGETIAQVTQAQRVEAGVLYVKVENAVWRNELALQKEKILGMVRERTGTKRVKDIRFI